MQKNKGFTLLELMVVIAIIGILSLVVLAFLGSSKSKGNDSKVQSHLKSMVPQAQLFTGTMGTAYVVAIPYSGAITGAAAGGTAASGTLFNDTTSINNGLYRLATGLPSGTIMYYGWDGVSPVAGGKWFFAATTSTGAFCTDYTGTPKVFTGTSPTTTLATWTAAGVFPNATAAGGYTCN
jgi:type IV pilus assembly protein PilA